MYQELIKYLRILKKQASRFERIDINNNVNESFSAKYLVKIVFIIISIVLVCLLKNGFSESFVSYVSSVLSILVGLFITALIFSFDKFYEPSNEENPNSRIKLWETQAHNYAKKFAYITSYTIVLSIFTLVILVASALFEKTTQLNVFNLTFCFECIKNKEIEALKTLGIAIFVIVQRFLVLYWLLKIMYNTLFIVSSMVQYMTTKIDRK
ncbi:MAG: hypothetical protein JXL97_19200 [Bacteroidales bacterium]|nr:hypothetical protein [Bacteroidales bacterium]